MASTNSVSDKVKVYDTFSFNGEWVVQIRLKYLFPYVDEFVIVESWYTHSGEKKSELFKEKYAEWFEPYTSKIKWIVIEEFPEMTSEWLEQYKIHDWMKDNHSSWYREAYQRDIAGMYIASKKSEGPFYIHVSDADEIPSTSILQPEIRSQLYKGMEDKGDHPLYLEMEFFYYNFHWKKKQKWYRAYLLKDSYLTTEKTLTYWRVHHPPQYVIPSMGWHLSYFMSISDLQRKLTSFAHRECDQEAWRSVEHIKNCIATGMDLFNRGDMENLEPTPEEMYYKFPVLFSTYIVDLDKLQEA